MKPKTLILMVVAVTCGLGASYMTSRLLAERQSDDTDKVVILVAKKNLDMGTTIKKVEDLFEEKKFTRGDEPKNAIVEAKDLQTRVLKRALRAGDFITGEDLMSDKDGGLSPNLPQGYRAIGIRVNIQDIASGFASLPLSRVDVLWSKRGTNDKDKVSRVILENVLVLAADQQTNRAEGSGAMPATVVSLALKPEDCLKVDIARQEGTLSLVLRKFNDHLKSEITAVSVEELVTGIAGRKDIEEGNWVEETGQPPIAKINTPGLPKETQGIDVAHVEPPKGTLHRLRLIEGDKERVVEYWLGDDGEVIHNSATRTEVPPAPPRPPQPAPSTTTPTPASPIPNGSPWDDDDDDDK